MTQQVPVDDLRLGAKAALELERRHREEKMTLWEPTTRAGVMRNFRREPYGDVQSDIWQAVLDDKRLMFLILGGGNRGSKTQSTVQLSSEAICHVGNLLFTDCVFKKRFGNKPLTVRHLGEDLTKSVEGVLVPKYEENLMRSKLRGGSWSRAYSKGSHTIHMADGGFIEFLTYGQDVGKHQGSARHIIIFDEWPPENIFKENIMRSIDHGGLIVIAATPTAGTAEKWALDLCEDVESGRQKHSKIFFLDTRDNYHIDQERVAELQERMSKDEADMRISGKWIPLGGRVLPEFDAGVSVIPTERIPNHWPKIVAMDTHNKKPNHFVFGAVNTDKTPRELVIWEEGACDGTAEKTNQMVRIASQGLFINSYQIERATSGENHNLGMSVMRQFVDDLPEWIKWQSDPMDRVMLLRRYCKLRTVIDEDGQTKAKPTLFVQAHCEETIRQLTNWSFRDPRPADRWTYSENIIKVEDDKADCVGIIGFWAESYLRTPTVRTHRRSFHRFRSILGTRE